MLVDTNILVRILQPHHPLFHPADRAIAKLRTHGHRLHLMPQNLIELWAVMTRPTDVNGLGMNFAEARAELDRLERFFTVLPETPALYSAWKRLMGVHEVSGKPAHDARLVAAMQVHGLIEILTFDKTGFTRYLGLRVIDPREV